MISGIVTPEAQALIPLVVRGPQGQQREISAAIDTGFNGSLCLSLQVIEALGLVWRRRGRALLADGSESVFDIYEGTVIWDGEPRRIPIEEAGVDPLAGMALMRGYELRIQVVVGGSVTLQRLS